MKNEIQIGDLEIINRKELGIEIHHIYKEEMLCFFNEKGTKKLKEFLNEITMKKEIKHLQKRK